MKQVLTPYSLKKRRIYFSLGVILVLLSPAVAKAGYTTATAGTVVSDGSNGGNKSWISLTNLASSDGNYATSSLDSDYATSEYLKCTNFGFAVPTNATIVGVLVTVERSVQGTKLVQESLVKLVVSGSVTGNNKGTGAAWATGGTDETVTYGSSSDLWGCTLTPAIVNASNFGVVIDASMNDTASETAQIDLVQVKVFWTAQRLYFSKSGPATATPSYDSSWNYTSEAARYLMLDAHDTNTPAIGTTIGPWTAGQKALDRQYVSPPLDGAHTISGKFYGQLMVREFADADNANQIVITLKVMSNDGNTTRGTLLSNAAYATAGEFINNASCRNKEIADGDTLTSVDALDGDRIVIEIGYTDSSGITPEAGAKWGGSGTDLPHNETQTAAGVGWIELGVDLTFQGPTNIYRSVGITATALASGTGNNLTISGSTATFDSGLANNIGVGDAIQYDSDNNSSIDAVCFISGRTSSTSYTVKKANGAPPTGTSANDQDWSVFRSYVSLFKAEAGDENDTLDDTIENFDTWDGTTGYPTLDDNYQIWDLACYGDGTDTTAADFDWGGGTSASTYVRLFAPVDSSEVGTSQRHTGNFTSSGAYLLQVSNGTVLAFANDMMIEGLQVYMAASSADYQKGIHFDTWSATRTFYLYDTIVRGPASDNDTVWAVNCSDDTPTIYARNNIIYDWEGGGNNGTGIRTANIASGGYAYIYNNTIVNCGDGIGADSTGGVVVAKNNIVQNCSNGYNGTNFIACDYNISDLAADAPGPHSKNSTSVTFVDESNADHALRDFHLDSGDTAANDAGLDLSTDLTLAVATDIDGESRPMNSVMEIGADEVTVGGASRRVFFISSINFPRLLAIADGEIKKYQIPALRLIEGDWKNRFLARNRDN